MATSGGLLSFFAAATLLFVCVTTVQGGADPYLDKYFEYVRQNKHGLETMQKMFEDRDLDLQTVVELMGNNKEFAQMILAKLSAVIDRGTLQERANGDQVYVFESEQPDTEVLATCLSDLITWLVDLDQGVDYASRMWFARGKLDVSALYTLNFKDPGNKWLCQGVQENKTSQNPPFSGKYCYSTTYQLLAGIGICVPDTCSEEDVNGLSYLLMILLNIEPFYFIECTEPTPWSTADIGFTTGLAFFAFMVLCGSLYEIFLQSYVLAKMRSSGLKADVQNPSQKAAGDDCDTAGSKTVTDDDSSEVATTSFDGQSLDETGDIADEELEEKAGAKVNGGYDFDVERVPPPYESHEDVSEAKSSPILKPKKSSNLGWALLNAIMMSFSAVNNCKKLLSAKKTKNTMAVLNGLRVVSMFWVILGHSCSFYLSSIKNPLQTLEISDNLGFYAVSNGTLSVDTFFVLSGFLVTYLTLKQIDSVRKRSATQWTGFWTMFYFHRWWRLTPVYMAAMGIWALLLPHFGQGGWFNDIIYDYIKSICRRQWWTHPLYINNLFPWPNILEESCMGWSWYLANDMQFFVISPLIVMVLYKNGKAGLVLISSLMLVSLSALFGINWHYGFTVAGQEPYTDNVPDPENADTTYAKPYTRIPTYLVGMVVGYAIFKLKGRKLKIPPLIVLAGWAAALATLWICLYGAWIPTTRDYVPQATAAMYLTFHRVAWGTAIGWVIFACLHNYGGPIGVMLGWKFWTPLARLTYGAFLIHPVILYGKIYSDDVLFQFSYITYSYVFVANLVFSYVAALVLSLLVEGPTMGLEKVMFGKFKRS